MTTQTDRTKYGKQENGPRNGYEHIPKKGYLQQCSNYRTISLSSHASKVMLNIIMKRIERKLEGEINVVQTDFRQGRGTGIYLERGFASIPRPPVKRHTIFCHACPNPASLSTVCATVINKKRNNKTEKTRGLSCLAPTSVPSVLFPILLRIIDLNNTAISRCLLLYVGPPFEQCCTNSTQVLTLCVPRRPHFLQMAACFHASYMRSNIVFLCEICPELLHSYHNIAM